MNPFKIIIAAATAFIAFSSASAQEMPYSPLVELKERVRVKDQTKIPPMIEVSSSFQTRVKNETFEPSPDLVHKIQASKEILTHLTNELLAGKWSANSAEAESVMDSIYLFFVKIDASIEEGYVWQAVSANVKPPSGTPNAAPGMNPHAIQDPKLREQYIEAIGNEQKKNLKNSQQADLVSARESITALASYINKWAVQKGASRTQIVNKLTPEGKSRSLLKHKLQPPAEVPGK